MGGGGFSQGGGISRQNSNSFVDPSQQPFLDSIRGQGQGLQQGQQAGLNQFADQGLGRLFGQAQRGNNAQFGLANQVGNDPGIQGNLNTLNNFSNGNALQGQISNLGQNLGQFFNEQLLPGINQTSQLAGQGIGSGRNSVARGQATRDTLNAFSRGSADLEAQFGQQQIGAAQAGIQGGLNQFNTQAGINQQGINNLPGVAGLGLSQFTAPFAGRAAQAGLVGPTTVLDSSSGKAVDFNHAGNFSFGGGF